MSIQASWLGRKFVCDSRTVQMLDNLTFTTELDVEEQETKDGKAPTKVKGFRPQSLTTTHRVSRFTGGDPLREWEEWQALLGKRSGFHIEGRRIGPPALILDDVRFVATAIGNDGEFLAAEIQLTFSEDVNFKIAPSSASEKYVGDKATPENAPGYRPNGGGVKSAYDVRPSAAAAEAKGG